MLPNLITRSKSSSISCKSSRSSAVATSSRGAALVLVAIMIFTLLSIVGLVIDLARLEMVIRRLQNAADGASIASATLIEASIRQDAYGFEDAQTEIDNWAFVKKAVLAHLRNANIPDLQDAVADMLENRTLRYSSSGQATNGDCSEYDYDTVEAANLTVVVRRQIFCLLPGSPVPRRKVLDIETEPQFYCRANAVSVELQLRDINFFFARIMGFFSGNVRVKSAAFNRESLPPTSQICPNSDGSHVNCQPLCNAIDCRVLGISSLLTGETVPDYNTSCIPAPGPSHCS